MKVPKSKCAYCLGKNPEVEQNVHIMELGKKPAGTAIPRSAVKGKGLIDLSKVREQRDAQEHNAHSSSDPAVRLYEDLKKARYALTEKTLPPENGPYADENNQVARYAKKVFGENPSDLMEIIERLVDTRPVRFIDRANKQVSEDDLPRIYPESNVLNYCLDREALTPLRNPTAGSILNSAFRFIEDSSSKEKFFMLGHKLEPYVIAVAALRAYEVEAYLAYGIEGHDPMNQATEKPHPLIAIVDLSREVPLMTFDLLRFHFDMDSIELLSDTAVLGIMHTIRAESLIKILGLKIYQSQEKHLSNDAVLEALDPVAKDMADAFSCWPSERILLPSLLSFRDALLEGYVALYSSVIQTPASQRHIRRKYPISNDLDVSTLTEKLQRYVGEESMKHTHSLLETIFARMKSYTTDSELAQRLDEAMVGLNGGEAQE